MTTKKEILKSIRLNCLECSGGSSKEVQACTVTNCTLHQFRYGKDLRPARKAPKNGFQKKNATGGNTSNVVGFGHSGTNKSTTVKNTPPGMSNFGKKRISDGDPDDGSQEGGVK